MTITYVVKHKDKILNISSALRFGIPILYGPIEELDIPDTP